MDKSHRIPGSIWAIVAGMCVFWCLLAAFFLPGARGHDFLNLYTGASLALDGRFADLHNTTAQLAREQQYYPDHTILVPFVRPSFYALLLSPLALLSYQTAFVTWLAVQTSLLIGTWVWAWWRFGANSLVFAAMFLPAPLGIATGQDCVFMLVSFAAAYELTERKRYFAAGATLALMLFKFHLVLLWPLALLIQRRWKMLAGYCVAAAAEVGLSLWLGGFGGARQYVALLQDKSLERLSPSPELMLSFQGLTENLGIHAPWAIAALLAGVMILYVYSVKNAPLWRTFTLTAFASLFMVPHVYAYDAALLLVPVLLIVRDASRHLTKVAAVLFATPIPFLFALADKPYSIVSSASLLAIFLLVANESLGAPEGASLRTVPNEA
jgi:hypothetical protein